jgi:hypothetical protein
VSAPRIVSTNCFQSPVRARTVATAPLSRGSSASRGRLSVRPPPGELLRALPALKESLGVNIELASPPDFIPELPGWRERSQLVFREGKVEVHNFDLYSQALSKIERGFDQDLNDVEKMMASGSVEPARLRELYEAIEPELYRYPAIDPSAFRQKLDAVLAGS